ncbi:MAG: tRNA (adenosine(37)-N6)-dimethylallyltransferase MiaA [Pseudomonadota bacterium]|nr:tRNA (adenosine(37)-N6)-dimethylallyltransferase MiaA [Pseudomonadota bacterium]
MADHSEIARAAAAGAVLMICGPTAAGKSGLALALAERCGGMIINADSMQLYGDLRILTARPDDAEMARAPHRLYGVVDGAERASVAAWLAMAADAVAAARGDGALPIIVGGTGLYFHAALHGIAPIPEVPSEIHAECIRQHADRGGAAFRAALAKRDPVTAERLHDGDSQRLVRAMGVVLATGRPLSVWQADPHQGAIEGVPLRIAMMPARDDLYATIDRRFEAMMTQGAAAEVAALAARGLDPSLPVMKAIGVREIMAMQAGDMTRERAIEIASRDSRRYAKRQMTWIRNNFNSQIGIETQQTERNIQEIFAILSKTG